MNKGLVILGGIITGINFLILLVWALVALASLLSQTQVFMILWGITSVAGVTCLIGGLVKK